MQWRNGALVALTLAYPPLVYWGLGRFEPRWLAFGLLALGLVRGFAAKQPAWRAVALLTAVLAGCTVLVNASLPLKLYPVLVSAMLGLGFAWSLAHPPSAIERLARLSRPQLNAEGVAYTRRVTQVWLAFFCCNGAIAAATAMWGSDAAWALYNGLLSYALMGVLFAGEWPVRQRVQARHG